MSELDQKFWVALTARLKEARRAGRSPQEQLAEAEAFLEASDDLPLRPELTRRILDEVTGRSQARQATTFPVGANLERDWRAPRSAAAALLGSVLILGGIAVVAAGEDSFARPDQPLAGTAAKIFDYPEALQVLVNPAEGVARGEPGVLRASRRNNAHGVVAGLVGGGLKQLQEVAASREPIAGHARQALAALREVWAGTAGPVLAVPLPMERIKDAVFQEFRNEAVPLAQRLDALALLQGQIALGLRALATVEIDEPNMQSQVEAARGQIDRLLAIPRDR